MFKLTCRIFLSLVVILLLSPSLPAVQEMALDSNTCLGCHNNKIFESDFAASVHGKNGCNSCHVQLTDLSRHVRGGIKVEKVHCERCHKKETAEHYASVHIQKDIRCADCHTDVHTHRYWKKDKRVVVAKCIQCHDREAIYRKSIHGRTVAAGNQDSAACHDCHKLHEIKAIGDKKSHESMIFHTKVCMKCHSNAVMMKRNKVFNVAVETYMESYHGKNYRLGYPERVAGCADCHTSHAVLKASDPAASVNPANLLGTCRKCHTGARALFTKFYAHGEHKDREKYPLLYWTFISMTALLVSTFSVFWVHSIMWMFRGFVENRDKAKLMAEGKVHFVPSCFKLYRRFNTSHIMLHLLVIVSFLGLAMTGLPLKFSDQQWARPLMALLGGAAHAAFLHRIFATMTFLYFISALVMCIHFLFFRKNLPGNWLARLLGPESLCPNRKDIQDVAGMIRWFLFRGPKPTFDRWTYWEKFDFLAVFWGMFAIGGSGLMLWFPEVFGRFLPGWFFNVATIIHSDEALLATGFIFTVHFFNTHARPEKFPMDFVIFNGQLAKHEFIEERGAQWQRYEETQTTEDYAVKKASSVFYDFIFKSFAMVSYLTGAALLFLIFYSLFMNHH